MATVHPRVPGGDLAASQPRRKLRQRIGSFGESDRAQLGIVSFSHGIQHSYGAALGICYPFVLAQFHESYAVLGLLLGILGVAGGVMQAMAAFVKRLSARVLLAGQNYAIAVATALGAVAPGFAAFAAARAVGTLSSWPQHPVGSAHLVERFPHRRGFVLSVHTAGGSIGSACVPLIASALIVNWGWRWTLVFFACMMALGGLLVTSRLKARAVTPNAATPQADADVEPDMEVEQPVEEEEIAREASSASGREAEPTAPTMSLRKAMTSRRALAIVIAGTLSAAGRGQGVLMIYVPGYLKDGLHLPTVTVGLIATLVVTGGIVGPVIAGRTSDRFDRRRVLLVAYAVGACILALFVRVGSNVFGLVVLGGLMGVFSYSEQPLRQALFSDTTQGANARGAFGLYWALSAAGAFWLTVIGAIATTFGFQPAFYTMAGSFVLAGLVVLVVGRPDPAASSTGGQPAGGQPHRL